MKQITSILIVCSLLFFSACTTTQKSSITKTEQQEKTAKLISTQNFVFLAEQANPQNAKVLDVLPRGQQLRNLTPGYYLSISKDTVKASLPFFGKAYGSTNYGSTDDGIKFKTTKFTYHLKSRKKGGYQINISVQGERNVQELILYVSDNGYASLQVQSINRDIMGFYGKIEANKTDIL